MEQNIAKGKRGMITAFVIVGIVFIALITIIAMLYAPKDNPANKATNLQEAKEVIQECIDKSSLEALELLGLQGGRLSDNSNFYTTHLGRIAYLPSAEIAKSELENYLRDNIPNCLDNIGPSLVLNQTKIDVEVTFSQTTKINADWTIKLEKNNSTASFKAKGVSADINFLKLFETAEKINNSKQIPLYKEEGIMINAFQEDTYIYRLIDINTGYIFQFVYAE